MSSEKIAELEQENRSLFVRNIQLETGIENKKIYIEALNKQINVLQAKQKELDSYMNSLETFQGLELKYNEAIDFLKEAINYFEPTCEKCDCGNQETCSSIKAYRLKHKIKNMFKDRGIKLN